MATRIAARGWPATEGGGSPEVLGSNPEITEDPETGGNPSSISEDGESSEGKGTGGSIGDGASSSPSDSAAAAATLNGGGAESSSNDGSLSSCDNFSGKRDKYHRLSRRTFRNKKGGGAEPPAAPAAAGGGEDAARAAVSPLRSSSRNSPWDSPNFDYGRSSMSEDDKRSPSQSSDSTFYGRLGALRLEEDDLPSSFAGGRRDGRSFPVQGRRAFSSPLEPERPAAPPHLHRELPPRGYGAAARGRSSGDASSWSGMSHGSDTSGVHRQPSERRPAAPKRRHCRPVAGGAPFVVCSGCDELLQLPVDFLLSPGRRRLRCGSCSEVLAFWSRGGGRLLPAPPEPTQNPPANATPGNFSTGGEPEPAGPPWRRREGSPLHGPMMGYNPVGGVDDELREGPYGYGRSLRGARIDGFPFPGAAAR